MHDLTQEIVDGLSVENFFDSHFIIQKLHDEHPDDHHTFIRGFETLESAHGQTGKIIDALPNVRQVGKAMSYNIRHNPSEFTCWERTRNPWTQLKNHELLLR
jgi:hypothetical protein